MIGIISIGVGAGVVSALLTLVITTGGPIALLLYSLAPLPIAIAALGWNHKAGLVGALVGAAILAVVSHPYVGGVFAVSTSLPAWWFSFLALLARPAQPPSQEAEWYPIGRVLVWIAAIVAALTVAGIALIATDYDAYTQMFVRAVDRFEQINPGLFERVPTDMRPQLRSDIAAVAATMAFPVLAALSVIVSATLLVVAGRVVLASGRLPRPWPPLPALVLPKALLPALALTLAGSLFGGFVGLGFRVFFAALATAYALQGLATLHALTVGATGRRFLLFFVYLVCVALGGWPLIGVALVGLADALFNLRARRGLAPSAG